jgi:hypothetical protein
VTAIGLVSVAVTIEMAIERFWKGRGHRRGQAIDHRALGIVELVRARSLLPDADPPPRSRLGRREAAPSADSLA